MKARSTLGRRKPTDIIPPDGILRASIDRPIKDVDRLFATAFGWNRTPTQTAAAMARAQGSVALMDVGCGSANTLRTWGREVSHAAPCALGSIGLLGIDKRDYSRESGYPATVAACESGDIDYVVADALDMPVEPGWADVALAYTSLSHSDAPVAWLRSMMRATRPGGVIYFTASSYPQYEAGAPLPAFLRSIGNGDQFETVHARIGLQSGQSVLTSLCWLEVPEVR